MGNLYTIDHIADIHRDVTSDIEEPQQKYGLGTTEPQICYHICYGFTSVVLSTLAE